MNTWSDGTIAGYYDSAPDAEPREFYLKAEADAEIDRLREAHSRAIAACRAACEALGRAGDELCCYADHNVSTMAAVESGRRQTWAVIAEADANV